MQWPIHGGQPETMKQLFHMEREKEILDFSANLNPLGPPPWLKDEIYQSFDHITKYPDPNYPNSHGALAAYERLTTDEVLLTNGGAEAIFLVAKLFEGGKAFIVQPTFVEYERACEHYHIHTEDVFLEKSNEFQLPLELILDNMSGVDVIFLCRPNNPTGTVVDEKSLHRILEKGLETNTHLVVDEAFVDFLPSPTFSLSRWLSSYPNLILLRSLTKMFTIPGLRIGYVLAKDSIIGKMKAWQLPWSINAFADKVVPKLLEDHSFVKRTHEWLEVESAYLLKKLTDLDYYVSNSKVNFYLLQDRKRPEDTKELFPYLFKGGILTRHTHNFKGLNGNYLRIAIRSTYENKQLIDKLQEWRNRR
ncbi:threonine-phosphate decarboxylase [Evansella vedderi]|uniref:threonine-phosphate decarboxylase n=1 Tax=Evansella vedderi TaxID=38282 RepID=A0ABT9ZYM6_9BACI|nr:threonine-phosphate decarboxylase CobD [Evansella vedderi]MDQ0256354.1 threonine-phosphate decarboxylase [Evansella vedderi]